MRYPVITRHTFLINKVYKNKYLYDALVAMINARRIKEQKHNPSGKKSQTIDIRNKE